MRAGKATKRTASAWWIACRRRSAPWWRCLSHAAQTVRELHLHILRTAKLALHHGMPGDMSTLRLHDVTPVAYFPSGQPGTSHPPQLDRMSEHSACPRATGKDHYSSSRQTHYNLAGAAVSGRREGGKMAMASNPLALIWLILCLLSMLPEEVPAPKYPGILKIEVC